jgi:ssDNA-binding Zn-finger/Zn-ribbon topoisomerase 1
LDDLSRESLCEHCEREWVLSNAELELGSFTCPRCAKTSRAAKLPAEIRCPRCNRLLALDKQERLTGTFSCNHCVVSAGSGLPAEVRCPSCRKQLRLNVDERGSGAYTCPFCRHEVRSDLGPPPPSAQAVVVVGKMSEELIQRRARRDMVYGGIAFVVGAGLTVGSLLMGEARFIVAYGPIIYGVWRFVRGASAYKPLPKPELPRATATLREPDDPTS